MNDSPMLGAAVVAVRSAAVLAAAWGAMGPMRRSSAAARHAVWCMAVGAVLAMPVLSALPGVRVLPRWAGPERPPERWVSVVERPAEPVFVSSALPAAPIGAASAAGAPDTAAFQPRSATISLSPQQLLVAAWGLGALAMLVPLALGRLALRRQERRSAPADERWRRLLADVSRELGTDRPVRLLVSDRAVMPMAWGIWRARILLPDGAQEWGAERRRLVLTHELAHVKRWDCLTQLLAQLVRALHWFNPLAWIALHAMQAERERACDDLVLRLGSPGPEYARELVEVTAGYRVAGLGVAAMAMARPSQLEGRVREILDGRRNRANLTRWWGIVAAGLAAAVIGPIAVVRSAAPAPVAAQVSSPRASTAQEPSPFSNAASQKLNHLAGAVRAYQAKHDRHLPPDLGATLEFMDGPDAETKARAYLSVEDEKHTPVPAEPTPQWVNENTSYIYLGVPGLDPVDFPPYKGTVVLYERAQHEYKDDLWPRPLVPLMLLANPAPLPRPVAEAWIELSKQAWEAAKTGAPFPRELQVRWDLERISGAMWKYTETHNGQIAPDLGSLLPYIGTSPLRLATPAQRAAVFISPTDRPTLQIPTSPTPQWVNQHASYVYLGRPGIHKNQIANPADTILLHGRLDEVFPGPWKGETVDKIPIITAQWAAEFYRLPAVEEMIPISKQVLAAAAGEGTLPEYQHAILDITQIARGIRAYAKAHGDALPPDLGSVLEYIPADGLLDPSPRGRAAIFLSPRGQETAEIPEHPTPEWVDQNAWYIYFGSPRMTLSAAVDNSIDVLVHGPLGEPLEAAGQRGGEKHLLVPMAGVQGGGLGNSVEHVAGMVARAKAILQPPADDEGLDPRSWGGKPGDPVRDTTRASHRLRLVEMAVMIYAQQHGGKLPPDLGATFEYMPKRGPSGRLLTPAQRARNYLAPRDDKTRPIPEDVGPDWINQNTSFVYLGSAEINQEEIPGFGELVIVHDRLDRPYNTSPPDPTKQAFVLGFLDNHTEIQTDRTLAEWIVVQSRLILEAQRTGAPYPALVEASRGLQLAAEAIHAYAKDHGGGLPPSLGDALPYVPARGPRLATPAQRAAIFLAPGDPLRGRIPEQPTPMWVNDHTAYTYLGGSWLNLKAIPFAYQVYVVRGDLNQGFKTMAGDGREMEVFLLCDAQGAVRQVGRGEAESLLAQSSQILTALHDGGPLPDDAQAGRDLRAIMAAISGFAKAHDGELPPDLGSVMNDIPADALPRATAQERARVFLSPQAKRSVAVPADPSPAWVNAHTSYLYLGGAGLHMVNLKTTGITVLVRAAEPMEVPWGQGPPQKMILHAGAMEDVRFDNPEQVARWTEESRKQLDAMRGR